MIPNQVMETVGCLVESTACTAFPNATLHLVVSLSVCLVCLLLLQWQALENVLTVLQKAFQGNPILLPLMVKRTQKAREDSAPWKRKEIQPATHTYQS